ncbi:MAG: ribonuclease P protein component [Gammaproteobacteria bacterium]|nr:ribonuclease P protein component [Gammaproteobacteria bacterium]MDD9960365.1 ribonuclease P protein component [Gammaproteobacteria bacterium]
MAEFGFPKNSRLQTAADYKAVFDHTQHSVSCRHFLMLAVTNNAESRRLGLVIAKKNVNKAVQRNRLKRQIRESFRTGCVGLGAIDVVVLARRDADKLSNAQVANKLNSLWQDLESKVFAAGKR